MADATLSEHRAFDLHTAGTDYVEGSALAVASSSGAITIDGVPVSTTYVAPTTALAVGIGPGFFRPLTDSRSASGAGTTHDLGSVDVVSVATAGTFTGTIQFEASTDGSTWHALQSTGYLGDNLAASQPFAGDAAGEFWFWGMSAYRAFRINVTAYTSGTITYTATAQALAGQTIGLVDTMGISNAGDGTHRPVRLGGTGEVLVGGHRSHDTTDSGNPIKIGGHAYTGTPTAVANNDRADAWFGSRGQLATMPVDSSGNPGLYTEDAALGTNGTGTLMVGRRDDALSTLTPVENDAVGLRVNSRGALWVVSDGAITVGGATAHDSADGGAPIKIGGYASSTPPTPVQDADRVNAWYGLYGQQATMLVDSSGNAVSVGGGTQYTEGDIDASITGTALLWEDTSDTLVAASATKPLPVNLTNASVAVTGTFWQATQPVSLASTVSVAGDVAHDAVDSGSPVKIGGRAWSGTPVATGDRVDARFTTSGALFTVPDSNFAWPIQGFDAIDAAIGTNPIVGGGRASTAVPTAVTADGDVQALWLTRTGATVVDGGVANDAVDSGNPIKIGGKSTSSRPGTVAIGDRVDAWLANTGAQVVAFGPSASGADAITNSSIVMAETSAGGFGPLVTAAYLFNGTSWDRPRSALGVTGATSVGGLTASDAAIAVAPLTIGGRASNAAPTAVSTDGDVVDARFTRTGALNVYMVDQSGAAASLGGGTQYAADVALGTATGTVAMARASSAVPTDMSADGDAVPIWASRKGAQYVSLVDSAGAAVATGVQYLEDGALGSTPQGSLVVARRDDALATLTPVEDDAASIRVNNRGALWVSISDGSGNQITSFGGGTQYVEDAPLGAVGSATGSLALGRASAAVPTAVSADADAVAQWFSRAGVAATMLASSTGTLVGVATPADDLANTVGLAVVSEGVLYDGSTWDRWRSTDAYVTASSTPSVGIAAALAPDRRYSALTLATALNSTQQWDCNGADNVLVHLGSTQTGTITFEVSADSSNWQSAEARDTLLDLWVSGTSFAPTANKVYRVITNGWRLLRVRVASALNGTLAVTATAAAHSTVLNSIDSGPAPHNFGYSHTGVSAQYTTTQTSTTIGPTVSSTQRLVVMYLQIDWDGTTEGAIQVYFGTGAFSRGTSKALFDGGGHPTSTARGGFVAAPAHGWLGASDEELKITTSAAINPLTVTVWYYLINA